MTPDQEAKTLAHVAAIGRHFAHYIGALDSIVVYVAHSMGESAPPPDLLNHFLRLESTQRTLEVHYETSLFQAPNKLWRLISLAPITDVGQARRRLAELPPSPGTMCSWCWGDAKGYAEMELKAEIDLKGDIVPGRFLHRACTRPWKQLRALAASAESEES